LGGYREIHKYYMVYAGEKIRYKALKIAEQFVNENRIDNLDDVFYLTPEELQRAIDDESVDVREMIDRQKVFMTKVENIDNFPPVIDSRGKILRPDRKKPAEGEILGDPVSAGKVKGKVVLINFVGEKEIHKGDILAAKAADPGLDTTVYQRFRNSPRSWRDVATRITYSPRVRQTLYCRAFEGLTTLVKDGDMVEMDGATGLIRKVDETS